MWAWLMAVGWAGGGVFINDVQIDPASIAGHRLTDVTVQFDDQGNIRIDAPKYEIRLTKPATQPAPENGLPAGSFWLVTEDLGSRGHKVDVQVNGKPVVTLVSGQGQRVVDVSQWLVPGKNSVSLRANSQDAAGGSLYVYIGSGRTDAEGTMVMEDPVVEFGLGADREGVTERDFSFEVE